MSEQLEGDNYSPLFDSQDSSNPSSLLFYNLKNMSPTEEISTIKKETFTHNLSIINEIDLLLKNEIKDKYLVYFNGDEIPLIKIKDEIHFASGEEIKFYNINDDNKFNECETCKKRNSFFYCNDCHKNKCENCSNNCKEEKHNLIDLQNEKKEIENDKSEIKKILLNYFIEQKEKIINPSEKDDINSNTQKLDKYSFDTSVSNSNKDIILINMIINKNYINYFHYQNIKECCRYLYNSFFKLDNKDYLKIEYNVNELEGKNLKIFGHTFVENNKDKVSLIINGKTTELIETICINEDYLYVFLIQKLIDDKKNNIEDMSCMFCGCESTEIKISLVKNGTILDLSHVKDISNIFKECSNLKTIDLNFLEKANNITQMDSLFNGCEELETISNIDKLDTKSVKSMNDIFYGCKKLKYLEGLNNMKTDNVEYLKNMFEDCASLVNLPNISCWNVGNVKNMKEMFKECKSLNSLPDISKWNVNKVENMKGMFKGCKSLNSLPDLHKWNVNKVENMQGMFEGCISLKSLPDISKWDVNNVTNMKRMFKGCKNIKSLPNLKDWNLLNLKYIDEIFFKCRTLIYSQKDFKIQELLNIDNIELISCKKAIGDD